jgi:molecular chaperone DnaK
LNAADALIFSTEKQIKEYGDKIPAEKKAPIEEGLKKLKDAYAAKDFAAIDAVQAELQTAWNAASEDMYKSAEGAPDQSGQAPGGEEQASAEDVTDVDFEEVKDDDK